MTAPLTTAATLNAYFDDLVEGGFSVEQAGAMARDAAQELIHGDGLQVRSAEDAPTLTGVVWDLRARLEKLEKPKGWATGGPMVTYPNTTNVSGGLR